MRRYHKHKKSSGLWKKTKICIINGDLEGLGNVLKCHPRFATHRFNKESALELAIASSKPIKTIQVIRFYGTDKISRRLSEALIFSIDYNMSVMKKLISWAKEHFTSHGYYNEVSNMILHAVTNNRLIQTEYLFDTLKNNHSLDYPLKILLEAIETNNEQLIHTLIQRMSAIDIELEDETEEIVYEVCGLEENDMTFTEHRTINDLVYKLINSSMFSSIQMLYDLMKIKIPILTANWLYSMNSVINKEIQIPIKNLTNHPAVLKFARQYKQKRLLIINSKDIRPWIFGKSKDDSICCVKYSYDLVLKISSFLEIVPDSKSEIRRIRMQRDWDLNSYYCGGCEEFVLPLSCSCYGGYTNWD